MRACLTTAFLVAALTTLPLAHADEADDLEMARTLFFQGQELAGEGRWDEARERFEQSLSIKRSAITLYSLGVAQVESGKLVEALESLQAFLAEPMSDATEPFREPAETAVAELEKRVARVTIRVSPADAEALVVTLDADPVPLSALGGPWLANPGRHRLRVEARDHRPDEQRFALAEGATRDITVELDPLPKALDAPPPVADAGIPALPIAFMIGGGATLLVATGLGAAALSEAQGAPTIDGTEADGARAKGLAADVLFGIGGGATAIGLVLLAIELSSDDDGQSALRPAPGGMSIAF